MSKHKSKSQWRSKKISSPKKSKFTKKKLSPAEQSLQKAKKTTAPKRKIKRAKPQPRTKTSSVRGKKTNLVKKLFIFIIFLVLVFGAIGSISLFLLTKSLPHPEKLIERSIAQSTKIYARDEKTLLYEIFSEQRRTVVDLEKIPQHLVYATIVSEDRDFFTHPGFDISGIARAILVDILRGGKVQGGSTLTQQFIKNAFLTRKKTYTRKIKELLMAYQVEKKFSKLEILQMYFNEIPYGSNAYGAEAASQIYFSKSVRDLTLDETTLLAALPKAPTYYSPYGQHTEELLFRQHFILDVMTEEGYITSSQALQAKSINTLEKITSRRENIRAPHFVFYVRELLTEKYGDRLVEQGGLKVITTLDFDKQTIAEQAIEKYAERNEEIFDATNAALVAIDVDTGQILAMVGSKDFFNEEIDGQVNVVTRERQPGSSFKPIVYATAFEKGYTPNTIIFDAETSFGPKTPEPDAQDYIPRNYDEKFRGPVSMRKALAGSLNIPGVKTMYLAGVNNVLNTAERMGYTTLEDREQYGLSLVLGGGEIKLLEHVAAFAIFAREGVKIPTTSILKVEDNKGNILEELPKKPKLPQTVFDPQIARLINDILSDNQSRAFMFGYQNFLTLPNRPVAAKTGTTNDFRDAWTVGFTPNLAAGVWVGNNNNDVMGEKADGSTVAAPIWNEFMKRALENTSPQPFTPPETIYVDKPILNGEIPGKITLKIDTASKKLATELTPDSQIIEKTFVSFYPILYYIDKNNPQGPLPSNPKADYQYEFWEEGITNWLTAVSELLASPASPSVILPLQDDKEEGQDDKEEGQDDKESVIPSEDGEGPKVVISDFIFDLALEGLEIPPTEYDDVHIPANEPYIKILSPSNNTIINENVIRIKVEASAPRGLKKITCSIDDAPLDSIVVNSPNIQSYTCVLGLSGISSGKHTIKATALDDVGNNNTDAIQIITAQGFERTFEWLSPKNNDVVYQGNFPLTLSVLTPPTKINTIKFFAQNQNTYQLSLISTIFNPETVGVIETPWNLADKGMYELWAEMTDIDGQTQTSNKIQIEIE
ncbi:PBP1A family penicillin-binding protein [Patescibacteria group bacterium AH-259-L05]|nr:PBP1A family penicillin-binding protein [Patescibacteria group bacterium AH-259-L05]